MGWWRLLIVVVLMFVLNKSGGDYLGFKCLYF